MNELRDLIEVTGNLVEEAWNNGRREAMKEIQGGKYEKLEETNRALRGQLDSYEKIRLTQDEEIHRLKADLEKTWEEKETLQVKHDNCGRNWREASKEIDRLMTKLVVRDEENDRLLIDNNDLREKLAWADAKVKELNEALETNQEKEAGRKPCTHGNVCRAYMKERRTILRQSCPSGCEFYKPKEVSDGLDQS